MAKLQSDRCEGSYIHKILMGYYCSSKDCGPVTLSLKLIRGQNPYKLQNLKILLTFQGYKILQWTKFLEFDFFYLKRTGI